jgi:hypothetical protein
MSDHRGERYRLELAAAPARVPAHIRLRQALKTLGRTYRLRCTSVQAVPPTDLAATREKGLQEMDKQEEPTMSQPNTEIASLTQALAAPFDLADVKFKPAVVSGNRALALAYVDARTIQDRLDEVLGVMGWQDSYKLLPDGSVMCRLRLKIGDEWIAKVDVGGQSEQPDGGDRTKAAFSDALKRAAVKFGVGRYLYRLPQLWCDYDSHKRQFVRPPTLPPAALPARQPAAPPPKPKLATNAMPQSGADLQKRLTDYDVRLAAQGVCEAGELLRHVTAAGIKAGHGDDLSSWTGAAIDLAVKETQAFESSRRKGKQAAA